MATHRAWRLRSRPVGQISDTDLELCVEAMPVPKAGNLLVKNLFVSIDPTHRIWMSDIPQVRTAETASAHHCGASAPLHLSAPLHFCTTTPGAGNFIHATRYTLHAARCYSVC